MYACINKHKHTYDLVYPTSTDETTAEEIRSVDSLLIDLPTLRAATGNFDEVNKLGEGGFGAVYKVSQHFCFVERSLFCTFGQKTIKTFHPPKEMKRK